MDASANNLNGSIPVTLANVTTLKALLLFSNSLSGTMSYFDVHFSAIAGTIPTELGRLPLLDTLNLQLNNLKG